MPPQSTEVKSTPRTDLNTTAYTCTPLSPMRLCVYTHRRTHIRKIVLELWPSPAGLVRVTALYRDGSWKMLQQRREEKRRRESSRVRERESREIKGRGVLAGRAFYGLFILRWLPLSLCSPASTSEAKRDVWCERVTSLLIILYQPTMVQFQYLLNKILYSFGVFAISACLFYFLWASLL